MLTPRLAPFALLLALPLAAQQPSHRFAREGVLGTSALLVVEAKDRATAERAETAVFDEVARLDCVLSSWRPDSELSQLASGQYVKVSPELAAVAEQAKRMRSATQGAFDPGVASLTELWTTAAAAGKAPDPMQLQAAAARLRQLQWDVCDGALNIKGPVTFDGIAKGFIADRAAAKAAQVDGIKLVSFQIGGDAWAAQKSTFQLVDPRHPSENGIALGTVDLENRALASSGGYARGFDIGGTHHSHIVDPRTGATCDFVLGASVVAIDVATADALATALCVLGPAGLPLLRDLHAHGVVVTADGKVHVSPNFTTLRLTPAHQPAAATNDKVWPAGFSLQIDFDIKAPQKTGGRGGWKRPYVAVWIEDITDAPARTLCLWLEDKRWLRDLRRWNRAHSEDPQFADRISQATRKAGSYTLTWDGKDDEGRQLAPGKYFVCIEAAREHGTYQLIRKEIELIGKPTKLQLDGNAEIDKAKLTFGKPQRSAAK